MSLNEICCLFELRRQPKDGLACLHGGYCSVAKFDTRRDLCRMHLCLLLFVSVHGQGILFSVMIDLALIRMKTFYRKPFVSRPINIAGSGTANSWNLMSVQLFCIQILIIGLIAESFSGGRHLVDIKGEFSWKKGEFSWTLLVTFSSPRKIAQKEDFLL